MVAADQRLNAGANAATITEVVNRHGIKVGEQRSFELVAAVPASAPPKTTVLVRVLGDRFEPRAKVSFGPGVKVRGVNVVSPTELVVTISIAKDAQPGARTIKVTNRDGSKVRNSALFTARHRQPRQIVRDPAAGPGSPSPGSSSPALRPGLYWGS
jgi:hypothetical protein